MASFTERREKYHTGDLLADIRHYVDDYDNVTMAELARDWPEHFSGGPITIAVPDNTQLIMWVGLTQEGADVITQLFADGRVEPCEWMAYMIDGSMLNLPIARKRRVYKRPHWLPIKLMRAKLSTPHKSRRAP